MVTITGNERNTSACSGLWPSIGNAVSDLLAALETITTLPRDRVRAGLVVALINGCELEDYKVSRQRANQGSLSNAAGEVSIKRV